MICYLLLAILVVAFLCYKVLHSLKLSVENKAIFITGCDSGFGLQLALHLAKQGFVVFAACLSLSSDGAKQLQTLSRSHVIVIMCDVTNDKHVDQAKIIVEEFLKKHSNDNLRLWALVNNAGIGFVGDLELMPLNVVQNLFEVNFFGCLRVTRTFLPLLRQSRGRVINMASLSAFTPCPTISAYCSSKTALLALTDCLRLELNRFGVLCIGIEPGFFKTHITETAKYVSQNRDYLESAVVATRDAYQKSFYDYMNIVKYGESFALSNIFLVVDALEHAIIARFPHRHYLVPLAARLFSMLVAVLPRSWYDRFVYFLMPFYGRRQNLPHCSKDGWNGFL